MSSRRSTFIVAGYDFSFYLGQSTDAQTPEHEKADILAAQRGDTAAWDRLCMANVRYVIKYAERLLLWRRSRMPIEDAVQAGLMGLCEAVRRFETERGLKLLTYATSWIFVGVCHAMPEYLAIRVPHAFIDGSGNCSKNPHFHEAGLALACVNETSIFKPPSDGDREKEFFDTCPSPDQEPADIISEREEHKRQMRRLSGWFFGALNERDRRVVARRFGIGTGEPEVMRTIGSDMGICKERVRQIQDRAIKKLRKAAGVRG